MVGVYSTLRRRTSEFRMTSRNVGYAIFYRMPCEMHFVTELPSLSTERDLIEGSLTTVFDAISQKNTTLLARSQSPKIGSHHILKSVIYKKQLHSNFDRQRVPLVISPPWPLYTW